MARERLPVTQTDKEKIMLGSPENEFCGNCQANSICGHGLLQQLRPVEPMTDAFSLQANGKDFRVGEYAAVEMADEVLMRLSAFMYLVPLFTMLLVVFLLQLAGIPEGLLIFSAVLALSAGFGFVNVLGKKNGLFPVNITSVARINNEESYYETNSRT